MDNKEEKKQKAHRKRDRFWKLVFPHYNKTNNTNSNKSNLMLDREKLTSEQDGKIASLSNYAQKSFSVDLNHELFASILENNNWDLKKAMADLMDYEEASHGILVEPPYRIDKPLLGSENDGGTSCYIDALLFAMYIPNTTFDPLLTYDIPPDQDEKIKLQTLLRLFVNKLRKGHFVNADYVHWLRRVMREAKWSGQNENGDWTQEDASELFMFITETFDLPYLPFQIRLFHGANKDTDDDRVMTDRTLTLSIPDTTNNDASSGHVELQDILLDYFYNNVITGVRRQVDYDVEQDVSENVATSPSLQICIDDKQLSEKDEKYNLKKLLRRANSKHGKKDEQAVTAWQVLELLPFYTASNEQGEDIKTQVDSSFPDTHMILPIVLKRYRYNSTGGSVKMKTHVEIPPTIDFNRFVNQNVDDPMCPTCGHLINWKLHFKSAVCHKGNSPYAGHYISYARVMAEEVQGREDHDPSFYWLKLDDMNASSRVTQIKDSNSSSVFQDLAENAYIIFYELDKTCHHRRNSLLLSSFSSTNSDYIDKKHDFKSIDDTNIVSTTTTMYEEFDSTKQPQQKSDNDKTYNNNNKSESSTDSITETTTTKSHHHHHHHHHKHYLKESCRLM